MCTTTAVKKDFPGHLTATLFFSVLYMASFPTRVFALWAPFFVDLVILCSFWDSLSNMSKLSTLVNGFVFVCSEMWHQVLSLYIVFYIYWKGSSPPLPWWTRWTGCAFVLIHVVCVRETQLLGHFWNVPQDTWNYKHCLERLQSALAAGLQL